MEACYKQLDAVRERGGVVGLNYATSFLRPDGMTNADFLHTAGCQIGKVTYSTRSTVVSRQRPLGGLARKTTRTAATGHDDLHTLLLGNDQPPALGDCWAK